MGLHEMSMDCQVAVRHVLEPISEEARNVLSGLCVSHKTTADARAMLVNLARSLPQTHQLRHG